MRHHSQCGCNPACIPARTRSTRGHKCASQHARKPVSQASSTRSEKHSPANTDCNCFFGVSLLLPSVHRRHRLIPLKSKLWSSVDKRYLPIQLTTASAVNAHPSSLPPRVLSHHHLQSGCRRALKHINQPAQRHCEHAGTASIMLTLTGQNPSKTNQGICTSSSQYDCKTNHRLLSNPPRLFSYSSDKFLKATEEDSKHTRVFEVKPRASALGVQAPPHHRFQAGYHQAYFHPMYQKWSGGNNRERASACGRISNAMEGRRQFTSGNT